MKTALLLAVLVGWVATESMSSAAARADAFTLVENGRPAATIVVAASPSENAKVAAAELQRYVERISGARLPIAADSENVAGRLIVVGKSRLTDRIPGLRIPDGLTGALKEEGFVLRTVGDRLVAAGNDTEPYYGTRYAVAALLNRLGVRWFLPGAFGEVVPHASTLQAGPLDVVERPSFPFRMFWEHSRGNMDVERQEWQIRNFYNPRIQKWVGVPGDSSLREYLPHDQFKAHPNWFALQRDGKRDENMACMTSQGMIDYMVGRLKQEARAGKRLAAFAPDDGSPRCYCDRCAKLSSSFDGYGSNDRDPTPESSTSQEWFYFVGKVLDGVNEEYPDFRIATNGYSNRELAPNLPGFNRRKNLVVMFANICACTIHAYDDPKCWQMARQAEMIRQWTRSSDKVWLYDYNEVMLVTNGTPTPMVHRLRRNLPLLHKWGVFGFDDEECDDWSITGLATHLVRSRLEWNVNADVDGVLADFYEKWYGPSAGPMRAYYDALEHAFDQSTCHAHENVVLPRIYTPQLMEDLDARMKQAESAASAEPYRARVHLDRLIHDHLRAYVAMESARQQCRYREAAGEAARMVSLKEAMNQVTPFMGWRPYAAYDAPWEKARMEGLAALTDGTKGGPLAALPESARFRLDPNDDGRYAGWFEPKWDDSTWKPIKTTAGWETQGYQSEDGHPARGTGWYRINVDVPESARGQKVHLMLPAVVNEAWVWVNGRYAGHRPYLIPWSRPHAFDVDVTGSVKSGAQNQITVRVLSNFEVFGASGLYERGFLYSPL